ncbi:hypothetical protein [Streptomyces canus]|uniref:hypothetical protein n=1 Tax=Streptomyces canus TaxID=58343 RepID=UPI003F5412E0
MSLLSARGGRPALLVVGLCRQAVLFDGLDMFIYGSVVPHGRFGAVFGPWLGGQLLASGDGDRDFTAFAVAGLPSMVFIGIAGLRSSRQAHTGRERELVAAHRPDLPRSVCGGVGPGALRLSATPSRRPARSTAPGRAGRRRRRPSR